MKVLEGSNSKYLVSNADRKKEGGGEVEVHTPPLKL